MNKPTESKRPAEIADDELELVAGGDGAADSIWLDFGSPTRTQHTSAEHRTGKYVLWDHCFEKPGSS